METSTIPNYDWAKRPVFDKMNKAIALSSIEEYFQHLMVEGSQNLNKNSFIEAIEKLKAGIDPNELKSLADNLANGGEMINMHEFFMIYRKTLESTTDSQRITTESNRSKVMKSFAQYLKEKKINQLSDLFPPKVEGGLKIIDESSLHVFFEKTFTDFTHDEIEQFIKPFRVPGKRSKIDYEKLDKELYNLKIELTGNLLDAALEEIRIAAASEFVDICEIFSTFDESSTGFISEKNLETGLSRFKVHLSKENLQNLCSSLEKNTKGMVSYRDLSKKLEQYSSRNSQLSPEDKTFSAFQQIRKAIKEKKGNTMKLIFKNYVAKDFDNKLSMTTKDFNKCLRDLNVFLNEMQITELMNLLDPTHSQQINYGLFCSKLGYVQSTETTIMRPMTGKSTKNPEEQPPLTANLEQRKIALNTCIVKVVKASKTRNLDIISIFQDYGSRKDSCITQNEFQRCLDKLCPFTSHEINRMNEEFAYPMKVGWINYMKFVEAVRQTISVVEVMSQAFKEFERMMGEKKLTILYALIQEWDTQQNRKFSKTDMSSILLNICQMNILDNEMNSIVQFYDAKGTDMVDYELLENHFLLFIEEKKETVAYTFDADKGSKFGEEPPKFNTKKVLSSLADQLAKKNKDLVNLLQIYDSSSKGFIARDQLIRALTSLFVIEKELLPSLNNLVDECDAGGKGNINYVLLSDMIQAEIKDRNLVQEYLLGLKNFLLGRNIDLLKMFENADVSKKKCLSREQFVSAIEDEGFIRDKSILHKVLDTLTTNYEGKISYIDFLNKVNNTHEARIPEKDIPSVAEKNEREKTQMIEDIGRTISQNKVNISNEMSELDYNSKGVISEKSFADVLKGLHLAKYTEKDYIGLARNYADASKGGVRYKDFLSELNHYVIKSPELKHMRSSLNWAQDIIDSICVSLTCKREDIYTYFAKYGMIQDTSTINENGFIQGLMGLKINIKSKEIDQLASELKTGRDKNIPIKELDMLISTRKENALAQVESDTIKIVSKCFKNQKINFIKKLENYDKDKSQQISKSDFEQELKSILGGNLTDLQVAFLSFKFENESGQVNYVSFSQNVMAEDASEITEKYRSDPFCVILIDKLRDGLRARNIRLHGKLENMKRGEDKNLSIQLLKDIFPSDLLTNSDLELLIPIIEVDPGEFKPNDLYDLLWATEEEEKSRESNATSVIRLCKNIGEHCKKNKLDLEGEFLKLDRESSGFLSSDNIQRAFHNLGMTFSPNQMCSLLYSQKISNDSKYRKSYIELAIKIFGKTALPERLQKADTFGKREEKKAYARDEKHEDTQVHQSEETKENIDPSKINPIAITLTEDLIEGIAAHINEIKTFLEEKGIKIDEEFKRYQQGGYLDFTNFCKVLVACEIELPNQDWQNAFYSYFKEKPERKVSFRRLCDAFVLGIKLKPFQPKLLKEQKEAVPLREEILSSGVAVKKLADFVKEKGIQTSEFKKYATGGRKLTKANLASCFQGIKFECQQGELDFIFQSIDPKKTGVGSCPVLITLLNEQSGKVVKKIELNPQVEATINHINRILKRKKHFYK